ncbi:sulfite exporter TauE/SafE family protein [Actinotignum schaalii]|uniref:sulfite exporter TauE/SafE family protein n=1 Tax=Actinotignum schaalii TaxID=59505 RepID=UPI00237EA86A|nr:sulfite exporter TauE/SafE family protein [Actinotignum schaalii]MDE1654774.1 sulfite exporter TauE/SafE family protein [Actinotignum schaalii]
MLACGVGIAVGFVVGLLGAGGGILTIPILLTVFGHGAHQASAESIIIVGVTSLVGMISAALARRVRWGTGLVFALVGIPGTLAGAFLAGAVSGRILVWSLSVLLVVVALSMFWRAVRSSGESRSGTAPENSDVPGKPTASENPPAPTLRGRTYLITVVGAFGAGALSGFFGVGGGFVVVPALILLLRMPARYASATSLLVMTINMVVAGLGRIPQFTAGLSVDWVVVALFTAGSALGSVGGEAAGRRIPDRIATILFGVLLLAVAAGTLASDLL